MPRAAVTADRGTLNFVTTIIEGTHRRRHNAMCLRVQRLPLANVRGRYYQVRGGRR